MEFKVADAVQFAWIVIIVAIDLGNDVIMVLDRTDNWMDNVCILEQMVPRARWYYLAGGQPRCRI